MKTYQLKPQKFRAVQVIAGKLEEAAAAAAINTISEEKVKMGAGCLFFNSVGIVAPGEWVIIDSENDIRLADDGCFQKCFESVPDPEPVRTTVRFIMCGRKSCSHVLFHEERVWGVEKDGMRTSMCPMCGDTSFWDLNTNGQTCNRLHGDETNTEPDKFLPTPKMGQKHRFQMLQAAQRAKKWLLENPEIT